MSCPSPTTVASRLRCALVFAWMAWSVSAAQGVERAWIDSSGGAPRLMLDDQPTRARIFFGAPGIRPLPIGPEGGRLEFEFSPHEDEPKGATMHFRFGQTPGDVWLDDLQIIDLTTGDLTLPACDFSGGQQPFDAAWRVWPVGEKNTVGQATVEPRGGRDDSAALHIALRKPPSGHWPDYHLYHVPNLSLRKGHRYRVSVWARATPARGVVIGFYRPGATFVNLGGPDDVFDRQIKLAAAGGVRMISFPIELPWPQSSAEPDWSRVDRACQQVLDANPQALLIPRIPMDAPAWWLAAHPDDVMRWDDGAHERSLAVVTSADYRRDAAERLRALIEHLEARFGPQIVGYHPCGQNTGEWFYQDSWKSGLNGYAPAELQAWRSWLRERYRDDAALSAGWRQPDVRLDTAAVPTSESRRAAPSGALRDPAREAPLIDFAEFQQQSMAECVCELAHAAKTAAGRRKLSLFFYGYLFEFGPLVNGPATSGHYALRRVLDSPDIDMLCAPISYFDRGLGGGAPAMSAAESVALAGKMWLDEDDTHTHLATGTPPGSADHVDTFEKSAEELTRNVAQCATRNFACWWMDLGASGWFDDRRFWELMGRLDALDRPFVARPIPFRPEIAAAVDPRSVLRVAAGRQAVSIGCVSQARRALGRVGAPYGQYLLDDVAAGKVSARLFVMLAAWRQAPDERRRLLSATDGAVKVWLYAPGYEEDQRTTLDGLRELTGFACEPRRLPKAIATPTAAGKALGLTEPIGPPATIEPLFAAVDATPAETLATYSDGSAAVARRATSAGVSWFVGPPGLTSQLLRAAARDAGVHLFVDGDCNVYAGGPILALHASGDGLLQVDTGRPAPAIDLLSGEQVGEGAKFALPIRRGQTRVLIIGSADLPR